MYPRNGREAGTVGVERLGGRMVGDELHFSRSSPLIPSAEGQTLLTWPSGPLPAALPDRPLSAQLSPVLKVFNFSWLHVAHIPSKFERVGESPGSL